MVSVIKEIKDERVWTGFLDINRPATFTQSWPWKSYQESLGHTTQTFGWFEGNDLVGVCLVIRQVARRGRIYTIPHGPIVRPGLENQALEIFSPLLIDQARAWDADWIRWAPLNSDLVQSKAILKKNGYHPSPTHLHAERSLILDLIPDPEELLQAMRKTTRHEIQKAARLKISLEIGLNERLWDDFKSNYQDTVRRQRYIAFPLSSIQKEIDQFTPSGGVALAVARTGNQPIASAVIIFAHGSAFYHHGASSSKFHHLPAAHALHWALIQEARRRGCHSYNFWGIAPPGRQSHPWQGLSVFKKGFGGRELALAPTMDFAIRPAKYWPVWLFESLIRRWKGL